MGNAAGNGDPAENVQRTGGQELLRLVPLFENPCEHPGQRQPVLPRLTPYGVTVCPAAAGTPHRPWCGPSERRRLLQDGLIGLQMQMKSFSPGTVRFHHTSKQP